MNGGGGNKIALELLFGHIYELSPHKNFQLTTSNARMALHCKTNTGEKYVHMYVEELSQL